jgi:hypothetical protein
MSNNEDDSEELNNNKYEFLNAPILIEDFRKNYLSSLNIFLNDEKFKEKTDSLPVLKSSAISKYEKLIQKEENEKAKKRLKNRRSNSTGAFKSLAENIISSPKKQSKKIFNKGNLIRYIINDHELIKINLQAIEENNEINNKLTDPFNAYFHENNPKIRRKALEQIINGIMPKEYQIKKENNSKVSNRSKNNNSKNDNNNNSNHSDNLYNIDYNIINNNENLKILNTNLDILHEKYKSYEEIQKKKSEKYRHILKQFNDNCENHGIITLDQKIDYFVYLYKNDGFKAPKAKGNTNATLSKKNFLSKKELERLRQATTNIITRINQTGTSSNIFNPKNYLNFSPSDLSAKYINDLKIHFKFQDDSIFINMTSLENFDRDLNTKIKSFELMKNSLETSTKFIDKLRMYLRWKEISNEKVILRECDITAEKFLYLIKKKYFNFGNIHFFNIEHNNLGDTGGSYLLYLISKYSIKIDYLNIGYNKLGKQSCEVLNDILEKNNVKLIGLSIGGNKIGDNLFGNLSKGISKNTFLNKLFINDNDLGKISSCILGTILKYDKKLKFLDVSKNNFGDENIGSMLKGLICNTSLETLIINDMGLTNKSLRVFETTLCINSTLKTLFLERNKLTYKGWRLLSDILNKNKYIEYISLVGNNFENEYINLISEQQRQIKSKLISKSDYFIQLDSLNDDINLFEFLE